MEKKIISGPKIHFWAVGEAFFSDLSHFSGFADFARFADFGCLKHITKAHHLLSSHSGNEGKTDAMFIKNMKIICLIHSLTTALS